MSGFIAAIDLGSSKITGVVGRKDENNVITIMACESVPSDNYIRRGLVHNVDEVGAKVNRLITLLENKLDKKIAKVYVSLAGQSLHSDTYGVSRHLVEDTVTEELIKKMRDEAAQHIPLKLRNYGIADIEYFVDEKTEQNPVGVPCRLIEADYQLVAGRPSLQTNIEKAIKDKGKLKIAGFPIGALSSAAISLTPDDKMLGCAFIDFGGGTTTLSIYKGGLLRRLVTIPFGGKTITKDICSLNFTEEGAEQIKVKSGNVVEAQTRSSGKITSPFAGGFASPFGSKSSKADNSTAEVNKAIRMRLDEIVANLAYQIKDSGLEGQLGAGIIITGGASQMRGLDTLLTEKLKMGVRRVAANKVYFNLSSAEFINNPALTQVLGLLLLGNENCEHVAVATPQPKITSDSTIYEEEKDVEEAKYRKLPPQKRPEKVKKEKDPDKPGFGAKVLDLFSNLTKED